MLACCRTSGQSCKRPERTAVERMVTNQIAAQAELISLCLVNAVGSWEWLRVGHLRQHTYIRLHRDAPTRPHTSCLSLSAAESWHRHTEPTDCHLAWKSKHYPVTTPRTITAHLVSLVFRLLSSLITSSVTIMVTFPWKFGGNYMGIKRQEEETEALSRNVSSGLL